MIVYRGIRMRVISQRVLQNVCLEITLLKLQPHVPETDELNWNSDEL